MSLPVKLLKSVLTCLCLDHRGWLTGVCGWKQAAEVDGTEPHSGGALAQLATQFGPSTVKLHSQCNGAASFYLVRLCPEQPILEDIYLQVLHKGLHMWMRGKISLK